MRKRSKNILAILLAASVMSGTWSLPTVAADFSSEEILKVENQEGNSEEEIFTEDTDLEESEDIEENEETSSEVGIQEESVAAYGENDGQSVDIGAPVEDFSDTEDVGDPTAGSYGVKVVNTWVTPENKDDILGDGTVSYDAENHKLTLNNVHISSMNRTEVAGLIYFYLRGTDGKTAESATLELKGDNIINIKEEDKQGKGITTYIFSVGDLTIVGDGSLTVRNNYFDTLVRSNQSLTIEKVKLDFELKYYDESDPRRGISGKNIEIRNKAKVSLENGMNTSGNLVISDSTVTCEGGISAYKCSILNHSKVKVNANTCAFYLNNCDMSVKNSIVETDGEAEYSIGAAYSTSVKPNLNIEDSWVDGSGKFDIADRKISNSVVFEEKNGTVTGNAVIPDNVEVRKDHTLTISKPATLTVPSDLTLTNNGAMNASCNAIKGTVTGTEPVYTHGQLTQWVNDKKSHWKECIRLWN